MHYIIEKRKPNTEEFEAIEVAPFETKKEALDHISQELPDPENYRAVPAGWAWGGKRYPSKKDMTQAIGNFVVERLGETFGETAGQATAPDGRTLEVILDIRLQGEGAQETA